jgi:transcriptional regulator with XRE-family HTH domain
MSEAEWIERSIEDLIGNNRKLAADVQSALSASNEAAHFIKNLRLNASLTQQELGQKLGISQPRVSAMEKGVGPEGPTYGMLKRITRACNVNWSLEGGLAKTSARSETSSKKHSSSAITTVIVAAAVSAAGTALLLRSRTGEGTAPGLQSQHAAEHPDNWTEATRVSEENQETDRSAEAVDSKPVHRYHTAETY